MKNLEFVTVKETRIAKLCDNIRYKVKLLDNEVIESTFIDDNDNEWIYIAISNDDISKLTMSEINKCYFTSIINIDLIHDIDVLKGHLYKTGYRSIRNFNGEYLAFKYGDITIDINCVQLTKSELESSLKEFLKCESVKVINTDSTFDNEFDYKIVIYGLTDTNLFYKYFKNDKYQQLYTDMTKDLK